MKKNLVEQITGQDCSNKKEHTKHPEGYLQHHAWMDKMIKTHKQIRCKGCGLYEIWKKKLTKGE